MTWAPTGNNIAAIPVTYANGIVTVTGTTDGNGTDIYTPGTVTFK